MWRVKCDFAALKGRFKKKKKKKSTWLKWKQITNAPKRWKQSAHVNSRVGWSQTSPRARCSIIFAVFIKLSKLHRISVTPAVRFPPLHAKPEKWKKKKRRRILCRSSCLLAAGEQIKETWRRSIIPSSPSLLCCWQLVLFFSWKWWNFQVLESVEGLYITPFHSMLAFEFFLDMVKFPEMESCGVEQ